LNCKKENLDRAFASIHSAMGGDDEFWESLKLDYDHMLTNFNFQTIDYCLQKYIFSELDTQTPGDRGLGRMTSYIPRLGAYFRDEISNISESDKMDFYDLIQDTILRGYLVNVLFMGAKERDNNNLSGPELYDLWIPAIYSSNPSEMGENLQKILSACSESANESLYAFINDCRISKDEIMPRDETDAIFMYYLVSGFGLRHFEMGD